MFFCLQCGGQCQNGDIIYVEKCDNSDRQQWQTIGDTIRPALDDNLCLTNFGYNSENIPVRVRPCNTSEETGETNNSQEWSGFDYHADKFQLHPKADNNICLTQHHHPKSGERVFPQTCEKARTTDMWVVY